MLSFSLKVKTYNAPADVWLLISIPANVGYLKKALFVKNHPDNTLARNDEAGITQEILFFIRKSGQDIM
jgi:hypothetical protein